MVTKADERNEISMTCALRRVTVDTREGDGKWRSQHAVILNRTANGFAKFPTSPLHE